MRVDRQEQRLARNAERALQHALEQIEKRQYLNAHAAALGAASHLMEAYAQVATTQLGFPRYSTDKQ